MRIKGIEECNVTVNLTPGDCLLLADACRRGALYCQTAEEHPAKQAFNLAAAHMEALALIAAAQGLVADNREFLAEWALPRVREGWAIVGDEGKEVSK